MSAFVIGSMPAEEVSSTTVGDPLNAFAVRLVAPADIRLDRMRTRAAGDGGAVDVTGAVWRQDGALLGSTAPFTVAADEGVEDPEVVEYDVPLAAPVELRAGEPFYLGLWVPGEGNRVNVYYSENYLGALEYLEPESVVWDAGELGPIDFGTGTVEFFYPVVAVGMQIGSTQSWAPGTPLARDGRPIAIPDRTGVGLCRECGRRPKLLVVRRAAGRVFRFQSAYCGNERCSLRPSRRP